MTDRDLPLALGEKQMFLFSPSAPQPARGEMLSLSPLRHPHLVKLARRAAAKLCVASASPKIIPTSLHAPLTDEIIELIVMDNSLCKL